MSWGKDPSKWGKPITVRFEASQLEALEEARSAQKARLVLEGRDWYAGRYDRSEFIRAAVVYAAKQIAAAARPTPPAASDAAGSAETGAYDAGPVGRKTPPAASDAGDRARKTRRQRPLKLGRTKRGRPAKGRLWSKVDRLARKKSKR